MRHAFHHVIFALGLALSLPAVAQTETPPEIPVQVYRDRRERLMRTMKNCVGVLRSTSTEGRVDPAFFY